MDPLSFPQKNIDKLEAQLSPLTEWEQSYLNPFTANLAKSKFRPNFEKQIALCVSTGRELSFEWSHHRISSTDSNVRVTLQTSIKYYGSERINYKG